MNKINLYISDWGMFFIPDGMPLEFLSNKKKFWNFGGKPLPPFEIAPLPKNELFWQWLHEEEVKAGKPA